MSDLEVMEQEKKEEMHQVLELALEAGEILLTGSAVITGLNPPIPLY